MLGNVRIFIVMVGMYLFAGAAGAFTLEFTEAQLQEKIDAMMPLEKKRLLFTIVISDPALKLLQGEDRLNVRANLSVKVPGGVTGSGKVNITGKLRYDKDKGEFYLDEPVINEMHVDKVPDNYQAQIKSLTQKSVEKAMARKPVYKLKDDNVKQKLAKSTLQSVRVDGGKLIVEFGLF